MSSSKAAAAKAAAAKLAATKTAPRGKPAARPTAKPAPHPAAKPAIEIAAGAVSADATRLAGAIEQSLADGHTDLLTPAALQALMAAACKAYAAKVEAGDPIGALSQRTTVTPTEVMVTASGLLRAANLAVFELGMWQSWTGR